MQSSFNPHEIDVNILSMDDIENTQRAFNALDLDNTGFIDKDDLKSAFDIMGEKASKEDIIKMVNEIGGSSKGTIDYNDFLKIIAFHRMNQQYNDENDFVDAFVAMGGNPDKSGKVDAQKLIQVIKEEFNMTIDIVKLIEDVDEDGSGEIEYDEFRTLLSNQTH